jgi:putative ABC transport system substrate-binding protein
MDYRWSAGDTDRIRRYAAELVAIAPDVILANGGTIVGALRQATRTVPIAFVSVTDPVGEGYVASLAQPGGNATGFSQFEYRLSGKWLELLKRWPDRGVGHVGRDSSRADHYARRPAPIVSNHAGLATVSK